MKNFLEIKNSVIDFINNCDFARPNQEQFKTLVWESFTFQYENIEPYRNYCKIKGKSPDNVDNIQDIPFVPTSAFKSGIFYAGNAKKAVRMFATSGTTGAKKGKAHYSADGLELMDVSIIRNAREMLFSDNVNSRIAILVPSPEEASEMIIAYGMDVLRKVFGLPGSGFFIRNNQLDVKALMDFLRDSEKQKIPVTLIGATFGFVHLMDSFVEKGVTFSLPEESRIMHAGGFKGKSRELAVSEINSYFKKVFRVPDHAIVNLLGMTELSSQFYDNVIFYRKRRKEAKRVKFNSPWTLTFVADPETLKEVALGEKGILMHIDLANLERPSFILTDDIGIRLEGGFEVMGRVKQDGSRGCSITIDELVTKENG